MRLTIRVTVQIPMQPEFEVFRSEHVPPTEVSATFAVARACVRAMLALGDNAGAIVREFIGPALQSEHRLPAGPADRMA